MLFFKGEGGRVELYPSSNSAYHNSCGGSNLPVHPWFRTTRLKNKTNGVLSIVYPFSFPTRRFQIGVGSNTNREASECGI